MFHWDDGLFLNAPRLALDVRRGQPHAFMSHAHADHIGPHRMAFCTRETALIFKLRRGGRTDLRELRYREPMEWGGVRLTAYPAGHCLGSAMLLVEGVEVDGRERSLLYTGDYKLGTSATCEAAEFPHADVLIMESTFGKPRYRLPPREETVENLISLVHRTFNDGHTPVIHAYQLGKSQEATALLTSAGISVRQHPSIYEISQLYQSCGVDLGDVAAYDPDENCQAAVITFPKSSPHFRMRGLERPVSIALTGWAVDAATAYRWQVDHALPLSDHADFEELMQTPALAGAEQVYCTHGPREFVEHLRAAGVDARPVQGSYQLRMF
ncbi:MAG: hypothetical protein KDA61_03690 [Planctomycetales bacterium]|nr:hypothetical protein [Planctomycetales bacterium]